MGYYYSDDEIAVVGAGGVFPDADNVEQLWSNILDKKVSIRKIPDEIVNSEVYFRPEYIKQSDKKDKTYTQIAAIGDSKVFSNVTRKFKIPPSVAEHMDNNQLAAIYSVDQAIQGLSERSLPKERTAVIFGNGMPGLQYEHVLERTYFQLIEHYLRKNKSALNKLSPDELDEIIKEVGSEFLKNSIPVTEDSAHGLLPNIVAGRIANLFDFWGPAYTVDAACASGLAAIICGIQGLLRREFDAVVSGAADLQLAASGLIMFSAVNALSANGSFPFDTRADGFVMGAGAGAIILKRLEDAIRDGDKILGIISGYGRGSDGKGKAIAAPSDEGQIRVIQNACKMAGYPVDTIELIEAHGTGTSVGDYVEVNALKKAFDLLGASRKNYCGIGSVKSNIGHLKSGAGAPGIIKTVMSLHKKILPPTANVQEINPKLQLEGSPFYVLRDSKMWNMTKEHPRRANVSAFGFGGADYHIAMEEYREEFVKKTYSIPFSTQIELDAKPVSEVVLFSSDSMNTLKESFDEFIDQLNESSNKGFSQLIFLHNSNIEFGKKYRLALMASTVDELKSKGNTFFETYADGRFDRAGTINLLGISFSDVEEINPESIAILFPGQASQYPDMLKNIYCQYPIFKSTYEMADAMWQAKHGHTISSLVFGSNLDKMGTDLQDTKNNHPAIFISNYCMYKLLSEIGLNARYMVGHSLGEVTALAAGGMLSLQDAVSLVSARGYSFAAIPDNQRGGMVSIKASYEEVSKIIKEQSFYVSVCNINSPSQTVVGGTSDNIQRLIFYLESNKITYTVINVSHAFHSPLVHSAAKDFYNKISGIKFSQAKCSIMANHLVEYYPSSVDNKKIASMLMEQIMNPVRFVSSIQKMYQDGVRLFIEVGPGSVLSNLTKDILYDKDVKVLTSNFRKKNDVESLNQLIGELFVAGVHVQVLPRQLPVASVSQAADKIAGAANLNDSPKLVYSGASIGLPGTFKEIFSDNNFELIFKGCNLIEKLTDDECERMVDLNITRLVKSESGAIFKRLSSLNEVIQLAGKLGKIDMPKNYLIDPELLGQMTKTVCVAVAAGYEALADAGIPLVKETRVTKSGKKLTDRLALPHEMQADTGVIFANGFPMIEPFISEVSKFVAYKYSKKTRKDMIEFYESIISKVSDFSVKKLLSDWFALNYSRLADSLEESDVYEFNNNFISQIASQANNRLAQFIGAAGPNFQINAACSSTAYAVTLAEDMIRAGRARRMVIIGGDNASSSQSLQWLGAGFLCSGAATSSGDLYEAAVPFDNRRNGMIIGSGAVGLVIESEEDVKSRGMVGICRILGTHAFNMAGHQSRIDSEKFSMELNKFIGKMEQEYGIKRSEVASNMVYLSHETFTPKEGGCSQTEKISLERTFGDKFKDIVVCNTKGMTGHMMGASIEEAVAAKALQYQKIPPVVNYQMPDPELAGLKLSQGGSYTFDYVLRMIAGFGGQGNYNLLQKIAEGDRRIVEEQKYNSWLAKIASSKNPGLEKSGRLLVVSGENINSVPESQINGTSEAIIQSSTLVQQPINNVRQDQVTDSVLDIFSEITKYPKDMLDFNMEMEADLGIDTVKQATIFSKIWEKFSLKMDESLQISSYPTIGNIVDLVISRLPVGVAEAQGRSQETYGAPAIPSTEQEIETKVLSIITELTKYPEEMLEHDMEIEADLGIGKEKLEKILSILKERFGLGSDIKINILEFCTIADIIHYMVKTVRQTEAQNAGSEISNRDNELEISDLSWQVPVLAETEYAERDFDIKGKHIWIIGDYEPTIFKIADALKHESASVSGFVFRAGLNEKKLSSSVKKFVNENVDVIIDCSHIGQTVDFTKLDTEQAQNVLNLNSAARFIFYKQLSEVITNPALRILCFVSIDGGFGCIKDSNEVIDPTYGALAGFYKGLRKEWNQSVVKVIDVHKSMINSNEDALIKSITDEVECIGFDYEIAYKDGKRRVIRIDDLDKSEGQLLELPENPHFLITGGALGISAEISEMLAKSYGGYYTLIGRTQLPEDIELLAHMDEQQLKGKFLEIQDKLKSKNKNITPVRLLAEFDNIKKGISIYQTLKKIEAVGGKAEYIACDVLNEPGMKLAIDKAMTKNGAVHVLIHAAGIEKSHLINKKSIDEFNAVFSVKALGAYNLLKVCPKENLKAVIAFTSISGRFGNEAQLDYCAANNFLSIWIRSLKTEFPDIHAVSLSWSGWKDVGMAWRNDFVRQSSLKSGLNLIEPSMGANHLIHALEKKRDSFEIIVSKGLNNFADSRSFKKKLSDTPLIEWTVMKSGCILSGYKRFSVNTDGMIDQHRLGDVPILPAVGTMELGTEFYALQEGLQAKYCLSDVSFPNAFKLFKEEPKELFMEGEREGDGWRVFVRSCFYPKNFAKPSLVTHGTMKVSNAFYDYSDMDPKTWDWVTGDKEEFLVVKKTDLYDLMMNNSGTQSIRLGKLYWQNAEGDELIDKNTILYSDKGVIFPCIFPREQLNNERYPVEKLLINPCFIDSMLQAAASDCLVRVKRVFLPWSVKEFGFVDVPRNGGFYMIYVELVSFNQEFRTYKVSLVDEKGVLRCYARNLTFRLINQ